MLHEASAYTLYIYIAPIQLQLAMCIDHCRHHWLFMLCVVGCRLLLRHGVLGELQQQPDRSVSVVQWDSQYDGMEVTVGEMSLLLQQISHGAGKDRHTQQIYVT